MGPRAGLDRYGKSHPPPGPRTLQPVASRYTDYASRPTDTWCLNRKEFHIIIPLSTIASNTVHTNITHKLCKLVFIKRVRKIAKSYYQLPQLCLSVRLSVRNNSAPTERIAMIFDFGYFFEI